MGKTHMFGFATAQMVFDLPIRIELHTVADITVETARRVAHDLDFAHATSDWRKRLGNPEIDVVDITAPTSCTRRWRGQRLPRANMSIAESRWLRLAADAAGMADADEAAGGKTQVGFNYLCNPMLRLAKEMIEAGEPGEIRGYRGLHPEGCMANAEDSHIFRHGSAGGGALADLDSHGLAAAEFLLGPIMEVMGYCVTAIGARPDGTGGRKTIEIDDIGSAFVRFANGATGSIEGNWIAAGCKMECDFEVFDSKGALSSSQERLNELHFYITDVAQGRRGFRWIVVAPEPAPYGSFCVAPGHQIGFDDLGAIEVAGFVQAIADTGREPFYLRKRVAYPDPCRSDSARLEKQGMAQGLIGPHASNKAESA